MLFQVITTLALVSSVVAGKLVPDKLVKKGFVERSVRSGSCMYAYQVKEAMALPLGACVPSLQNKTKIKFSKLAMQTFKQTNVVHLEVQGFADSKCKRKVGKQSIWHSAELGHCMEEYINYMPNAVTLNYTRTPPVYSDPGLVEVQFRGSNCGGPEHANPVEMNYAGNYQCVNGTISGSLVTRSMMVYSESNFVTEYTEFSCMGMSNYVNLPSEWNNIPTCWNYGTHSSLFQVNHYVYPTSGPIYSPPSPMPIYSPPSPRPTMMPVVVPVDAPTSGGFNATTVGNREYLDYIILVPPGAIGASLYLNSVQGDCDLYVSRDDLARSNLFSWGSTSTWYEDTVTIPLTCPEGCVLYSSAYGYGYNNYCAFWYSVIMPNPM